MNPAIQTLLAKMTPEKGAEDPTTNPFWFGQLAKLRALLASKPDAAPEELQEALGYTSEMLPEGVTSNREDEAFSELLTKMASEVRPHVKKFHQTLPQDKHENEHMSVLFLFNVMGILTPYLDYLDKMGVRSSMSIARHWFYMTRLEAFLENSDLKAPLTMLEVGAGGGHQAWFLIAQGLVKRYIIVDLPEMLLNSMITLSSKYPEASIHLNEVPPEGDGLSFCFLETENIRKVPAGSVDVAMNFNSLMEMAQDVRDFYIGEIYRVGRPGALFYNVNRRQPNMTLRNGETYDNNPLLYPYQTSDVVLEWEPDVVQQGYRSRYCTAPPSFCISRAALINT